MPKNHDKDSSRPRPAILQIIPRLDAGGAERATIDLARACVAAGYRALVASEGGRYEKALDAAGGEMIRLPAASKNPFTLYRNIARLAKIIRRRNVVLVHARSRAPAWSALYATRRTRIPLVATHHGIYGTRSGLKRHYNSVMVRGEAVIANSQWTADHIRKTYGAFSARLAVIPRGLELDRFDPERTSQKEAAAMRALWGADDETAVVFLPGRLTRWKGHLVLIEAAARLAQQGRLPETIKLVFAGDSQGRRTYADEIGAAIEKAGLAEKIAVSGHIETMPPAYLASDIVVSASTRPEAFGRVAAEAQAMGRPVIATDHGGARETILPGESGLLVPPGDPAALAEALMGLLALSKAEREQMGAKGRAHVAARFSVERMCADTLALYAELLDNRPES